MKNKALFWILAIVITVAAAYYQRRTGPTYPKMTNLEIGSETYKLKLLRSHAGQTDCSYELEIPDENISGFLYYKVYPTNQDFTKVPLKREGENLIVTMPNQPPAGKLQYYLEFVADNQTYSVLKEEPVIIRYTGFVPTWVLIPHIIFMFAAMLLSNLAGLLALFKAKSYKLYAWLAFLTLLIGGMILGPVVQKFAFGELWTGIPFGWDLTDNKTLIAFAAWILAIGVNLKKDKPVWVVAASVILLLVYSIPHSMLGSELDPETGEIIQNMILFVR